MIREIKGRIIGFKNHEKNAETDWLTKQNGLGRNFENVFKNPENKLKKLFWTS